MVGSPFETGRLEEILPLFIFLVAVAPPFRRLVNERTMLSDLTLLIDETVL
jgi:hypothetical protein